MFSGILQEMTIDEVREFRPEVVVMGVASTEPHGPILPYGTDFFQCDALCRRAVVRANERQARVLMYPTLPIGNNVNFKPFPFVCRIGVRTLMRMLLDILAALEEDGIRKVVLIDGHGGNTDALHATLREHFDAADPARRAFVCTRHVIPHPEVVVEHPSDHGGEMETSLMMHLRPDCVHADKLQKLPVGRPIVESIAQGKVFYVRPWHLHVPLAGGGETRASTADKGRILIESSSDDLADFLVELSQTPWSPNFPYAGPDTKGRHAD